MNQSNEQWRKDAHQKDLQRLRGFRPIDDTFMRGLFRENLPLAELVLRIITGKPDLVLTHCETQADMNRVTGARSICLDAYATDSAGKKYDLEIQRADEGAGYHRARYHSSVIDVENLDKSQDFDELPDSYVLFITEKDYYRAGKPLYVIRRMNLTLGTPFEDGTCILYVNGEYRGNSDLGRLMHDFNCNNADDMYFDLLAEKTRYLKENQEGVNEMCRAMEELREESFERGREEGRELGLEEGHRNQALTTAKNLARLGMSVEQIAGAINFSPEIVSGWLTSDSIPESAN